MQVLERVSIQDYTSVRGVRYAKLDISFEVFGRELGTAPVVVVFHALTGNSDVCSQERGWWKEIVGEGKVIDLCKYTLVSFNIPGNGYDGVFIERYGDFVARDVAILARRALGSMGVESVYATVGGSLGGGIAWELAAAYPGFSKHLVAIASDWKSTDWLIGICGTQEQILLHSSDPIGDARRMAMLFYRSPESLQRKFGRRLQQGHLHQVNSWLGHHGEKLKNRFAREAYLMMNHLLSTIDITAGREDVFGQFQTHVIQVGITSDLLFPNREIRATQKLLDQQGIPNHYYEIVSDDGHDAFLMEFGQLSEYLKHHF